jgi:predicted transport protein
MEHKFTRKTGKTLDQWKLLLSQQSFSKNGEYMTFLKSEHAITHGFANFITLKFREADAASSDADDLVANQYKGKESLKSIFNKLLMTITRIGSDVEVVAKKSAVSFRVKRQFTLIQPSTKKRIDLGLKLNDTPHSERLETSGPFGTMCTHRVQLTELEHVDNELIKWIKEAYEQAK